MIVKFFSAHNKGKYYATGGNGPKDYLLGKGYKDDEIPTRNHAKLLRGDPILVTNLINSLDFSTPYTTGCLGFDGEESERVTEQMKVELMNRFEESLFVNFGHKVAGYWVEHTDKIDKNNGKKRLELNFVFANVDLETKKFLPTYYDNADRHRINNFKDIANFEYKLSNPNDLSRKRSTVIPPTNPQNVRDLKQQIDDFIAEKVADNTIKNRQDVMQELEKMAIETGLNFKILSTKESSISISNPNENAKKNIRLEGEFYKKGFNAERFLANRLPPTPEKLAINNAIDERKIKIARMEYDRQLAKRNEFLAKNYPTPRPENEEKLDDRNNRISTPKPTTNRAKIASIAATNNQLIERIATQIQSVIEPQRADSNGIEAENTESNRPNQHGISGIRQRNIEPERPANEPTKQAGSTPKRHEYFNEQSTEKRKYLDGYYENANRITEKLNEHLGKIELKIPQNVPKTYTMNQLLADPFLRTPQDLLKFKVNFLKKDDYHESKRYRKNNLLGIEKLAEKMKNQSNINEYTAVDHYFSWDSPQPVHLSDYTFGKPIYDFCTKNFRDSAIMDDYQHRTTREFLDKYNNELVTLNNGPLDEKSIKKYFALMHPTPTIEDKTPEIAEKVDNLPAEKVDIEPTPTPKAEQKAVQRPKFRP